MLFQITVQSQHSGVSASDSDDLRSLFDDMREEFATLKAENIKTNKKLNQLMVENDQLKSQQHKSEHNSYKIDELIKENVLLKSKQHKSDNEFTLVKMENADMRLAIEEIKQDKYMYQMKPQEFKMIGVDENNTQYEKGNWYLYSCKMTLCVCESFLLVFLFVLFYFSLSGFFPTGFFLLSSA